MNPLVPQSVDTEATELRHAPEVSSDRTLASCGVETEQDASAIAPDPKTPTTTAALSRAQIRSALIEAGLGRSAADKASGAAARALRGEAEEPDTDPITPEEVAEIASELDALAALIKGFKI